MAIDSALAAALWPAGSPSSMRTWAILDAARDERIFGAVDRTYLEKCCLFAGELAPQLRAVAPYLVQLPVDDNLTGFILEHGWGNSWGVFLRSNASLETLRRHFRKFLRVRDHTGKHLLFRYYDPRVLSVYLPTCLPEELTTIFDGLDRFLVEAEGGSRMVDYGFNGLKLTARELQCNLVK